MNLLKVSGPLPDVPEGKQIWVNSQMAALGCSSALSGSPRLPFFLTNLLFYFYFVGGVFSLPGCQSSTLRGPGAKLVSKVTTLSGRSLGSCVDEERSQLRELM